MPPSRHQGTISRRFNILNVTFRPVSSERRQDTYIHTNGLARNHKAIFRKGGLKMRISSLSSHLFFSAITDKQFFFSRKYMVNYMIGNFKQCGFPVEVFERLMLCSARES